MDILDNELVKKYFGYKPGELISCDNPQTFCVSERIALKVFRAMREPIRKGDRILNLNMPEIMEAISTRDSESYERWHPFALRLPEKFQAAGKLKCLHAKKCNCDECCTHCPQPPATEKCVEHPYPGLTARECPFHDSEKAVEEDIDDILVAIEEGIYTPHYFKNRLIKLVGLARK